MLSLPLYRFADPMLILVVASGLLLGALTRRAALLERRATRRLALGAWATWLALWMCSTNAMGALVSSAYQAPPRDLGRDLAGVDADRVVMVVLSGGALRDPRDGLYPAELLGGSAYPRALGAARLFHEHPVGHVILSGVAPHELDIPSAENGLLGMRQLMVAFGVPAERIVLETRSTNTRENARESTRIAHELGAERVVLVTSALHMPRAEWEMRRACDLPVLTAPVDLNDGPAHDLSTYLPSVWGMIGVHETVHEVAGFLRP